MTRITRIDILLFMKTEKELDVYFYIGGWICLATAAIYLLVIHYADIPLLKAATPCVLHQLTGYYCPGCGGTRAVSALLHGHLLRAFVYHPFVPYTVLLGGYFMLTQTIDRLSHHKLPVALHFRPVYLWAGLGIILVNFVVKNALLFFFHIALL